jgi:hypothetical protein
MSMMAMVSRENLRYDIDKETQNRGDIASDLRETFIWSLLVNTVDCQEADIG